MSVRSKKVTWPEFQTRDAILAACYVWRKLDRTFQSNSSANSNSQHLQHILNRPEAFAEFLTTISAEDQELCDNILVQVTEDLVIKKLSGSINDFEQTILALMHGNTVTYKDSGKLAYLPEMYMKSQRRQWEIDLFKNSEHLGVVGHKIQTEVSLIRKKSILVMNHPRWQNLSGDAFLLICRDVNNNMIKIFHKDLAVPEHEFIKIRGKIKKQELDQDTGVPATLLHYVKIIT